ncbi:MAG: SusC/RagA family TonB-linked outer membrane protein [Bacteroidia bacterium]|nr:SusC/RagA family TonB-linked outer membrane protein [Bacteroidia bacterium]
MKRKDKRNSLRGGVFSLIFLLSTLLLSAQTVNVSGIVTDDTGLEVIGATVIVAGDASKGTITDIDGKYTLSNVPANASLQISYVGMVTQTVPVNGRTKIDVTLATDSELLDEVVVTALGIKRDKKALGYAIQEVKGDDIIAARENNIANALSGKVSGLQVIRSSNGPAASSKIVIRGNNSVTNLNQPLIVVDGVPMDNFTGADNNDYWNPSADMGNGLSDINPEDIQSMSVLKGASAAALYGSRAGNGVILITTKSGRKSDGLGITISSSVSSERIFMHPQLQNNFGQGSNGVYNAESGSSWGPEISGQEYEKWNKEKATMQAYDNLNNYFSKPGINLTENISFSQQYENVSIYTSINRLDDKSKIPGADLSRTNLTTRAISKFGADKKWTLDTKIQYVNTDAQNRPVSGKNDSNPFLTMYSLPRSMDIRDFSKPIDENGKMIWWGKSSAINPYWLSQYKLSHDQRERFIMFGSLKYEFTDWLNAEIRGGTDMYFTEFENKTYGKSPLTETGRYGFGEEKFYENNFSFLTSAQKDNIFGKWGGSATFGGNLMHRKHTGVHANPDELLVPNLFAFGNAKNKLEARRNFSEKKINSLYGTLQVNHGGYWFLDATFRNDWTSTLAPENRSFFYPSLSTSWVISDMINEEGKGMPDWFSYAKLRASWAQVGNDLEPYQLYNTYWIGKDPEDHATAGTNGTLYDPTVKNELITSWEIGTELRFFDNRLAFDFAWYKSNATHQLLNLPTDPMSGYTSKKINAGDIQNQGVELMINAYPIQTNDFGWNIQANFSKNKNTIKNLTEGVSRYQLGGYDNLRVYATVGGNYGEIYGTTFERVTDEKSEHFGKLVVDANGLPIGNNEIKKVGDQQADMLFGLTNSFRYKGLSFSFLIDSRIGGDIFSATNHSLQSSGSAAITAPNGKREEFIVDAVVADGSGYKVNDKKTTPQEYWGRIAGATGNLGITEANIYDATNIRLRNVQVNYEFSKKALSKTPLQRLKLGVSCNNVWMISSHLRGVDPESVFATSTNAIGFEAYAPPTSRTFLFNVTFGF